MSFLEKVEVILFGPSSGNVAFTQELCMAKGYASAPGPTPKRFISMNAPYRLGKFWFMYGTTCGSIQYINFAEQLFVPEGPGATGYWLKLNDSTIPCVVTPFLQNLPAALTINGVSASPSVNPLVQVKAP